MRSQPIELHQLPTLEHHIEDRSAGAQGQAGGGDTAGQQVSAQGVQTTFQEAKLQLLVKPHVTADGGVSMHMKVNRDEPNFNQTAANGAPTILKREAETDLLVMDGHTAVIGGILIGVIENLAHFLDSQYLHWGNLYEIAPFYVLIIILMIRPYGLFGTRVIERV